MIKFTDALILFLMVVVTLYTATMLTAHIVGYDLMLACIGVVSVSYAYLYTKMNKESY